ncbi:hypothetical protein RhiJN_23596 [Ceratobasidium sp. AG-Ba]|nr:hypothetical protein RhiJN_23596 [Ceratobasidium sp. AG-Ba]
MFPPQYRDYRRMLYRLDLATKYQTVEALVQNMMDQTDLDGILEIRLVTSNPPPEQLNESTPRQRDPTYISFRRETYTLKGQPVNQVNAIALYGPGPPKRPSPYTSFAEQLAEFSLEVRKRFPPRHPLVWAFIPMIQRRMKEGATSILFECRSYLKGSSVLRATQAADHAATADPVGVASREAAYDQQFPYDPAYVHEPPFYVPYPTYSQPTTQGQSTTANYFMGYQLPQDYYAQPTNVNHPALIPSATTPGATFQAGSSTHNNAHNNWVDPSHQYLGYYPPSDTATTSQQGQIHPHNPARPNPPIPPQPRKTMPAPRVVKEGPYVQPKESFPPQKQYRRMVGYVGKQHDGSVGVYELSDQVAAIAFPDFISEMGMAGVEAMSRLGGGQPARLGSMPF